MSALKLCGFNLQHENPMVDSTTPCCLVSALIQLQIRFVMAEEIDEENVAWQSQR